jgi:hypothetical protein
MMLSVLGGRNNTTGPAGRDVSRYLLLPAAICAQLHQRHHCFTYGNSQCTPSSSVLARDILVNVTKPCTTKAFNPPSIFYNGLPSITFTLLHLFASITVDNDKSQSPKDAYPRHGG